MKKAGEFLVSLQRPDGSITDQTRENADSAIGQTGYAVHVLLLLNRYIGGFDSPISAGQKFLIRHAQREGLWKYKDFLPPDLDDTTAALQALDAAVPEQSALIKRSVGNILDLQGAKGELRTWLVNSETFAQSRLDAAAFNITEAHAEVMSFFFRYLVDYGHTSFQKNIDAAAAYVAREQGKDGRWKTIWYRNDFYPTYRVVLFLSSQDHLRNRYAKNLDGAVSFVLRQRLSSGAWGQNASASGIDTALCLVLIAAVEGEKIQDLQRTADFLYTAQMENGAWPGEPFFFLDISQRNKAQEQKVFLGNELYSTALVTENLLRFAVLRRGKK